MSGMVGRRNQPAFWGGKVTWVAVRLHRLPACDDCLINVHEHGGDGIIAKAKWKRRVADSDLEVLVCERHKKEWENWTPGQMELLGGEA